MKPLKKPITFEKQLESLEEKGFIISDESACLNFLHHVNYYNLSAYLLPFKREENQYVKGINFDIVMDMYNFDQKMRVILFSAIEEIELFLRTQFAYYQAHTYCATAYKKPEIYNRKHNHEVFLAKIHNCIKDNKLSLVVKHHQQHYDGNYPIWVIIEYFSIGMLSFFYDDMLTKDKKYIAKDLYKIPPNYLSSWLKCLTVLRNKCAHYSRLYYWKFTSSPKFPTQLKWSPTSRLFDQILALKLLYPNLIEWNAKVYNPIKKLIEQYSNSIVLSHIGFPDNWIILLRNDIKHITATVEKITL